MPDCPECNMNNVYLHDVVKCAFKSISGIWTEVLENLANKTEVPWVDTLTKNDRLHYILSILIVILCLHMIVVG